MLVKFPITAEELWLAHRALLRGKSAITAAPLPKSLAECAPGVQASHYGLSLVVARSHGAPDPDPPRGLSIEDVKDVQGMVSPTGQIIPNEPPPPPPDVK